jgi:hypothetical protein
MPSTFLKLVVVETDRRQFKSQVKHMVFIKKKISSNVVKIGILASGIDYTETTHSKVFVAFTATVLCH